MTDTAVRAGETASAHPAHPLDPATAAEYLAGRDILAAACQWHRRALRPLSPHPHHPRFPASQ